MHQTQNPDNLFQSTEHQTAEKQNAPKRQPLLDGLLQKGRALANRNSNKTDRKVSPCSQGAHTANGQNVPMQNNENVCIGHNKGGGALCDDGDNLTSRNTGQTRSRNKGDSEAEVDGVRADSEAYRMDAEAT